MNKDLAKVCAVSLNASPDASDYRGTYAIDRRSLGIWCREKSTVGAEIALHSERSPVVNPQRPQKDPATFGGDQRVEIDHLAVLPEKRDPSLIRVTFIQPHNVTGLIDVGGISGCASFG